MLGLVVFMYMVLCINLCRLVVSQLTQQIYQHIHTYIHTHIHWGNMKQILGKHIFASSCLHAGSGSCMMHDCCACPQVKEHNSRRPQDVGQVRHIYSCIMCMYAYLQCWPYWTHTWLSSHKLVVCTHISMNFQALLSCDGHLGWRVLFGV